MAIEERRDMVDLMERQADEATQQAEELRESIQQQEQQIAQDRQEAQQQQQQAQQELQQIAQERQQPGADQQVLDVRQEAAEQQLQQAEEKLEDLAQQDQQLDEQREQVEQLEAFAEEKAEDAQEQRQLIAEDQQSMIVQPPPTGDVLGLSIVSPGSAQGRFVRLDSNSGREIVRSPLNTVNVKTAVQVGGRIFAIAGDSRSGGVVRLVEVNGSTLEMAKQGDDDIAQESLLWVNGQNLYAITNTGGSSYMARFNTELALQARSTTTVTPFATVFFSGGYLVTQRIDGSALLLNPDDLSEKAYTPE
jgi:chemotaxis protein histidine kinase CheA